MRTTTGGLSVPGLINDPVSGQSTGQTGNIGVYAAGYYPQVPGGCQPWLPMPGAGQCDISGVIPGLVPLDEDLQAWTLTSPGNPAFRGPSGHGLRPQPRRVLEDLAPPATPPTS